MRRCCQKEGEAGRAPVCGSRGAILARRGAGGVWVVASDRGVMKSPRSLTRSNGNKPSEWSKSSYCCRPYMKYGRRSLTSASTNSSPSMSSGRSHHAFERSTRDRSGWAHRLRS